MATFLELLAQQAGGGMNFTGGVQPYRPQTPGIGEPFRMPEPQAPTLDPEEEKAKTRRELIREEAWKLYTGEGPKRPDTKLSWPEMLAAAMKPEWLPMIMQRKMEPYFTEIEAQRAKGANLSTLAGFYPEGKRSVYNVGQGGVLVGPTGKEIYRNPVTGGGKTQYRTIQGKGLYEIGPDGKPNLLVAAGGAGDKLPAFVVNQAIRVGQNPYPSDHPYHSLVGAIIAAGGTNWDQGRQEMADRIYQNFLNKRMEQGLDPTEEDYKAAAEFSVKAAKAAPAMTPQQGGAPATQGQGFAPGWFAPGGMPASPGGYAPGMTNETPGDLSPAAKALYFRLRDLGVSEADAERAAMAEDAKRTQSGPAISP